MQRGRCGVGRLRRCCSALRTLHCCCHLCCTGYRHRVKTRRMNRATVQTGGGGARGGQCCASLRAPGKSPSSLVKGATMPRLFSTAACAFLILDAATIFMALVIFPMFLMALMRCLTASKDRARGRTTLEAWHTPCQGP